ncbi:ABC transporter permease [Lacticaseibacillus yichunensis]|uniref:FtsX-like permease family protein n=2 Tax=Bacilli TaxID=91061 RepID=A0ABW4CNE5_9LACO|nr:ABC transporter permease [Lacticaseibacillus yichunensis]
MRPMTKNMWREIGANKGRFIALILIILLGCLSFVGIRAAGPGLNDSLDHTVKASHLADVQLMSTTGFIAKDKDAAETVAGAKAELMRFKYVVGGKSDMAIALYGYRKGLTQNQLTLESGRLPKNADEIVLDQRAKDEYDYKLGQSFTFAKSAGLKQRTYKIVGFGDLPTYIDNSARGSANVGDGTVRFFAYIPEKQMALDVATLLTVRFAGLQHENTYSDAYKDAVDKKVTALKKAFNTRRPARIAELQKTPLAELTKQQATLDKASKQLTAAKAQVAVQSGGQLTTTDEITAQEKQLAASQTKLDQARKNLVAQTKTTYTWQTRDDFPGFSDYGDSSDRIAAIANVFPVFFFLIAALITFTTVTRMVEEARMQIGTFKALGYGKGAIARNYVVYALMAGLIGAVIGGVLGNFSLPRIILWLYRMYIPMIASIPFSWVDFLMALGFSLLATVGAAAFVTVRELQEKPAELMRPQAPKTAKRILLERITPLWRRLSFNQKVSYRNLFRYKSRMIMTIIGIAGGTGLLLTGFGLRDSILNTATQQFGEVFHYDATVRLKKAGEATKAKAVLADASTYQSNTPVAADIIKIQQGGQQVNDVNLFTPQNATTFRKYVTLRSGKTELTLPKTGLVISQKIADDLGVGKGAKVRVTLGSRDPVSVKVAAVTVNYVGVMAYMSKAAYQTAFAKTASANTLMVKLDSPTADQRTTLAKNLLEHGETLGTSFTADSEDTITTMSSTLNPVVAIFVLLSGVLSFVVLYNLTNINVSERMRELSTIKVLGFFDGEVTMYIVRENIVMTLMGIIAGIAVGWGLLLYILRQAATPMIIFPPIMHPISYIASIALMLVFTFIVMWVTHNRLKHIDMVEALKGNE